MCPTPSLQGVLQCFDQIACVHMSGLFVRSHMNAGQDGFRDKSSKQNGDLKRATGKCRMSLVGDRLITPSAHHLASSGSAQHGCSSSCSPCLADLWAAAANAAGAALAAALCPPTNRFRVWSPSLFFRCTSAL